MHSDGIPLFAPELAGTMTGMDPKSFEALSAVEATNFWFVARNELIVGLVKRLFPEARSFLEIGCGNGAVLQAIAQSRDWTRLVGSELHPAGLTIARNRMPRDVEFVQMDAREIPARKVFDLTGAFDVIEHIDDDEAVLRGMRRATRDGGGVIIAVPQHPSLWSWADDVALHKRRYRRGELEAKLVRNGFRPVFSTSYTSLLLPLMMASRWKDRRKPPDSTNSEFDIPPAVNRLLTRVLRFEVALTLAGTRWPAGGSRIVAARAI